MTYVTKELTADGPRLVVKRIHHGATPRDAKVYIEAVRAELDEAFRGVKGRHLVNLEDESQGGSFYGSQDVISNILFEVSTLARQAS